MQVCRTLPCALRGAERVTEELMTAIGTEPNGTDPSGMFTLMEVECLGACDRAPLVMVNDSWHECLQPDDAKKLVDDLRARGEAALTGCHHQVPGTRNRHPEPGTLNVEPILTKFVREPKRYTLDFYLKHEGYEACGRRSR